MTIGEDEISGEEIEQHGRKARLDERVHVAAEERKVSAATKKDREHAGREQLVGDEGRERRERGALGEPVVIDRPDEARGEGHGEKDQDENESLHAGQDEHAPPLARENLAVQEALKRRVVRVSGIVHLDPFEARSGVRAPDAVYPSLARCRLHFPGRSPRMHSPYPAPRVDAGHEQASMSDSALSIVLRVGPGRRRLASALLADAYRSGAALYRASPVGRRAFAWLGSLSALIMLSVAAVAEVLAYYIPIVDNLLDTLGDSPPPLSQGPSCPPP